MARILVGASVRQEQSVFDAYWRTLSAQQAPRHCTLDFVFVDDSEGDFIYPDGCTVLAQQDRPSDATYAIGAKTHEWQEATFEHLAKQKQRLLDYAIDNDYDYAFLADSDLILESTVLRSLHACKVDAVSAVFWTQWQAGLGDPMPQTWLRHPYGLSGLGMDQAEYLHRLTERELVRVKGGGACHLIRTKILDRVHYHPRLEGLPSTGMWQGEDRTFALLLEKHHINQWADSWPDLYHAYHPEMRTEDALAIALEHLCAPRQLRATYGDLISIRIEPMEIKLLQEQADPWVSNIRGRLGAIKLLPELETAVLDMSPGEERLVEVLFPPFYPKEAVRGKKMVLMLQLVDVRPFGYAPLIADTMFKGLSDD